MRGVYGNNGVIFGEVHDVTLFGIHVAFAVEPFDKVAVFSERFQTIGSYARHDRHIEYNVNGVGHFNSDFGKRRADNAHGVGNDIHGASFHLSARDLAAQRVGFDRIHPIIDGTRVVLILTADKRTRFHTRNVVFRRAVIVATGQFFLI